MPTKEKNGKKVQEAGWRENESFPSTHALTSESSAASA